jgi:hypothetical protein
VWVGDLPHIEIDYDAIGRCVSLFYAELVVGNRPSQRPTFWLSRRTWYFQDCMEQVKPLYHMLDSI